MNHLVFIKKSSGKKPGFTAAGWLNYSLTTFGGKMLATKPPLLRCSETRHMARFGYGSTSGSVPFPSTVYIYPLVMTNSSPWLSHGPKK